MSAMHAPLLAALVYLTTAMPQDYNYPVYESDEWDAPALEAYLRAIQTPQPLPTSQFTTDGQGVGQVSGIDLDSQGDLWVFHRAERTWDGKIFDPANNTLTDTYKAPIVKDTIFKMDAMTGKVISKMGANTFNVPHGLKFDGNDNMWLTDVGRHQVFRIPSGASAPDLTLGEKFVPGSDDAHFCKPTDVEVAGNGHFFVADGYCNSRIMKFDATGKLLTQWGTANAADGRMSDLSLNLPHGLTMVEELDLICVADRENGRAVCYNAGVTTNMTAGTYNRTIVSAGDVGKVFAIDYSPASQEMVAAVSIATAPYMDQGVTVHPPRAFSYSLSGQQMLAWAPIDMMTSRDGPSLIHTVVASKSGREFYLGDLLQQRVVKYGLPAMDVVG